MYTNLGSLYNESNLSQGYPRDAKLIHENFAFQLYDKIKRQKAENHTKMIGS